MKKQNIFSENVLDFEDINGNTVFITIDEIMMQLAKHNNCIQVFGMRLKEIAALRKLYMDKGGKLPVSIEEIEIMK